MPSYPIASSPCGTGAVGATVERIRQVQTDLDRAAAWLAVNWRDHLPQPVVSRAWGGQGLASLDVQAGTATAMAEAAALLGTDVRPDVLDGYVQATRHFGGVQVLVWLEADRWPGVPPLADVEPDEIDGHEDDPAPEVDPDADRCSDWDMHDPVTRSLLGLHPDPHVQADLDQRATWTGEVPY